MKAIRGIEVLLWIGSILVLSVFSRELGQGVYTGIRLCGDTLVPSLLPFLIFSHFFARSASGNRFCGLLTKILSPILGLPSILGGTFLMSLAGGYPVGPRLLALYLEEQTIDRQTGEKALCCCVNGGPSFLISGVGATMLGSLQGGFCLFLAQLFSAMTICMVLFWRPWKKKQSNWLPTIENRPTSAVFVESVQSGAKSMLEICLFVIVMSALLSLLDCCGLMRWLSEIISSVLPVFSQAEWKVVCTGLLEVTQGCRGASALSSPTALMLCGFFVSFGSFSVLLQIKAIMPSEIKMKKFYFSRIVHGVFTSTYALLLWKYVFWQTSPTVRLTTQVVPETKPNLLVASLFLIVMCSMVALWKPKDRKNFNFSQ